jgi:hypothetical protein
MSTLKPDRLILNERSSEITLANNSLIVNSFPNTASVVGVGNCAVVKAHHLVAVGKLTNHDIVSGDGAADLSNVFTGFSTKSRLLLGMLRVTDNGLSNASIGQDLHYKALGVSKRNAGSFIGRVVNGWCLWLSLILVYFRLFCDRLVEF